MTYLGEVRDGFPWLPVQIETGSGSRTVQFILDTGFDGELAGPYRLVDQLGGRSVHRTMRSMADGRIGSCNAYFVDVVWAGEVRTVEYIVLEGNLLAGTEFFANSFLTIDLREGGEVQIELP